MFIPRGKPVQENLATSYVRLEALVADLCEGGFSGVVEVVLRDADSFIVVNIGNIAAVVQRSSAHAQGSGSFAYTRTTLGELAEKSRLERGRLSIYGYSIDTANAVAGRINAQPLYSGLTTEFTDLEKMILKLVRERDREWFIEISTDDQPTSLIHMRDGDYRILSSTKVDDESTESEPARNNSLDNLMRECNQSRATFDVYFSDGAAAAEAAMSPNIKPRVSHNDLSSSLHRAPEVAREVTGGHVAQGERGDRLDKAQPAVLSELNRVRSLEVPLVDAGDSNATLAGGLVGEESLGASNESDQLSPSPDAEAMAEIKRLMGEIAKAIEEAAQAVDRPDSFSMSLRAGQLKIADRYPFLDPFAGEIEYLGGEIVFVGQATADEFILGLTEALKLAVDAVLHSTAYAERFRAYVIEDLRKLLAREQTEFEKFGLDRVIEQIIAF